MFDNFPYTNFHELNLDWIIKIAKDFLDQYTHIQETIQTGLDDLDTKAAELQQLLQEWYDTHSQDIADQLADALQQLNDWYTQHTNYLDELLQDNIDTFNAAAESKGAETLASIPGTYDNLFESINMEALKFLQFQTGEAYDVSMNGLTVYDPDHYYYNNVLTPSTSHRLVGIADPTIKQIKFPAFSTDPGSSYKTVYLLQNGTIVQSFAWDYSAAYTLDISSFNFDTIYFNYWNGSTANPWYDHVALVYDHKFAYDENINNGFNITSSPWKSYYGKSIYFKFTEMYGLAVGYMTRASATIRNGDSHMSIFFPAKYVKKITLQGDTAPGVAYAVYYNSMTATGSDLIGAVASGNYEFDKPQRGYIAVNYFRSQDNRYAQGVTIDFWNEKDVSEIMRYTNSVRKPFTFANKTGIFTGDSITEGFTDAEHITTENYPKLFSRAVGISPYGNKAVGGALFTAGYNEVTTIPEQVQDIQTPPNFLFIAGGVNDWQLNVPISSFKQAISDLCDYINTNMPNTDVIWITPINEAGWDSTHPNLAASGYLKTYCDAIYEIVKNKDIGKYSIVSGFEFGFPDASSNAAYKADMFGDLLHPSEKGYANLYVPGLLNALQ